MRAAWPSCFHPLFSIFRAICVPNRLAIFGSAAALKACPRAWAITLSRSWIACI